ncbi:MAG: outer membrane beta-barrel protein [Polaribacter sp.]|nr:outer membrane beta-barrel protein [Polaribacter sp.]
MLNKSNIDKLFIDKLKSFQASPDEKVWRKIERQLKKKKQKKGIPIWWSYSGIAALLILGFFLFPISDNEFNEIENNVVSSPKQLNIKKELLEKKGNRNLNNANKIYTAEKKIKVSSQKENSSSKKMTHDSKNNFQIALLEKNKIKQFIQPIAIHIENTFNIIEPKKLKNKTKGLDFSKEVKDNIAMLLNEEKKNAKKKKNWSISPLIGLLNSNSYTKSSPVSSSLSNSTKGDYTYSYGLQVSYQLNRKYSVQTGLHFQEISYQNKNLIVALSNINSSNINFDTRTNFDMIELNSNVETSVNISAANIVSRNGNLNQRYGYIEIPIEIKYNLIEKNSFKTELIVGASSLFLNENETTLETESFSSSGKMNNLNNINFSANLGVLFSYKFDKKWALNFSPMLKSHLNTFNNNSNGFKPYSFGVYSGINLNF